MMGFWDATASAGPLCKQSAPHSRHTDHITQFFTGQMLFLTPTNSVKALKAQSAT